MYPNNQQYVYLSYCNFSKYQQEDIEFIRFGKSKNPVDQIIKSQTHNPLNVYILKLYEISENKQHRIPIIISKIRREFDLEMDRESILIRDDMYNGKSSNNFIWLWSEETIDSVVSKVDSMVTKTDPHHTVTSMEDILDYTHEKYPGKWDKQAFCNVRSRAIYRMEQFLRRVNDKLVPRTRRVNDKLVPRTYEYEEYHKKNKDIYPMELDEMLKLCNANV